MSTYFKRILSIFSLAILCLALSSHFSFAQGNYKKLEFPPLNEFNRPEVETFTLDNGITFFMVEDRELPLVKMHVTVRAGGIQVQDSKVGLTDVVGDAMRSGGTESIPSDSLNRLLENHAASMETGIGFSSGSASFNVLRQDLDFLLPVFADLLRNPAFPKEKIELAKKQLKSQISRRNDNQGQIASREFNRLIYGKNSVYGRIPQYETVNNITREDVLKFHEQAFDGKDMMIGLVPQHPPPAMKKRLEDVFGDYPSGTANDLNFPDLNYEYKHTVNFIHKANVNQSLVRMGHIGGQRPHPDYATIQVLNNVLSGGFSGRLLQKIRTELGLSYSPGGQYGLNVFYPGLFYVSVRTKSASTAKVIKAVKEVILNLQQKKIGQEELSDAKSQFLNSLVFRYDNHTEILRRQMDLAYKGLPENTLERFVDSLKQVTREDIQEAARTYLKPEKMEILVVGNKKQIGDQLTPFGEVNRIDISIPQPGSDKPTAKIKGDTSAGKKWLKRMAEALLGPEKLLDQITYSGSSTRYNPRMTGGQMTVSQFTTIDFPDELKTELNTPQGTMTISLKDGQATRQMAGKTMQLPSSAAEQIQKSLRRNFLNLALNSDTLTAKYQGITAISDTSGTYAKLVIQDLDPTLTLYLDPQTHLPRMIQYTKFSPKKGGQITVQNYLSNWKKQDNIAYPFRQMTYSDSTKQSVTAVDSIEVKKK